MEKSEKSPETLLLLSDFNIYTNLNITQRYNFTQQNKRFFNKSTKDIILDSV